MDILRLYRDFSVHHATDGHKHCRPGWVQTECPYCTGNPGLHLGWNIAEEYYMCWRCGWHPPVQTISILLSTSLSDASSILITYGVNKSLVSVKKTDKKEFKLPSGITELTKAHRSYLLKRRFDPDEIAEKWGAVSLGPTSSLDNISYSHRVLIPFKWNGQIVSFDSRDTTDRQQNKYQACPIERESVEHKRILYGNQEAFGNTGIIVEGPTDVWRLGEKAAATSGIKFTREQVRVIANTFRNVAVVYDDEPQAQQQAMKLVKELRYKGVDAWNVIIKGDPGGLSQREADKLVKSILR